MSSGFSIGLNALQANASAIEVASKNIAASNVSGFKATEYLFQESLSRAMQPSSSGRFGSTGTGGVSRRVYSAGSTKYSASPLDMAINGEGFFTVGLFKEPSSEKTFFTRSGQFLTDKDGYVVSSSGLYLYGYQPTDDSKEVTNVVGPIKEPESPMPPSPTRSAFVAVNLDARLPIVDGTKTVAGEGEVPNSLSVQDPKTYSHVQQFPLYDKLGQQHAVSLYFRRATENLYDVYVNVDGQVFASEQSGGEVSVTMPSVFTPPSTLAVNGIKVREDSPYAVFTVTGPVGTKVELNLEEANPSQTPATNVVSENLSPLEYFDGSEWVSYFPSAPPELKGGKLLVRSTLKTNDDPKAGTQEFFALKVTQVGSPVSQTVRGLGAIYRSGDTDAFIYSNNKTGEPDPRPVARFGFFEGKLAVVGNPKQVEPTGAGTGNLTLAFKINTPTGNPVDPSLLLSDPVNFKLDFASTTNYASSFEVKNVTQDGYAAGSLSGMSVDDKGFFRGQFTNGRTVVAGRLQLATFKGLGGLREVSNNTYQATEQSGDPLYGSGADGIYGSIRANSIEEANTDMASELVRLMVQQRNYQANAQSIKTQVELLSVTIDVTR